MPINNINNIGTIKINPNPFQKTEPSQPTHSFANIMKGYLQNVDSTIKQSSELAVKAASGQIDNTHDLTIAAQKAKVALELTVTVRDKAVEAYNEVMRMQF